MSEPTNTSGNTSINQNTYLSFLRRANSGELLPTNRLAGFELRVVQELINEGLVSDSKERFLAATETNKSFLTPKGAIVLRDWERDLKQQTTTYKFLKTAERVLWLLLGAIISLVGKLVGA